MSFGKDDRDVSLPVLLPNWHIERCWEDQELQCWWRAPVRDEEPVRPTDFRSVSNVHVGDWFTHGREYQYLINSEADKRPQLSLVAAKTLIVEVGKQPTFQYRISHDIGGHYFNKTHEKMTDGYWYFVPNVHQLWILGYREWALKLLGANDAV